MNELTGASDTITAATETGMPATDAGTPPGHGIRTRENRDVEAFVASEDRLLESRAPQGAAATSGDVNGSQGAATGTGIDGTSMSHPGTGTDAFQHTDEGESGASGPHASQPFATVGETRTVTPESTDRSDGPSGGASATGSGGDGDAAVDALLAKEDLLLGISTRPDEGSDDGDDANANPGDGETTGDPPTGSDEPGPAGAQGHTDQAGKPDDDDAANDSQDGHAQGTGQSSGAPVRAESAGSDAQQEAVESPGEAGKQQPDLPEATPDQQPEVPQSGQGVIAEQVAAIKAELRAEYDADLADVKSELAKATSELAQMKETLAAQSKVEAPDTESAKRVDRSTEPDTTEQDDFRDRSQSDAGKDAEGRSNEPDRRVWSSDARLGLYAAVGQTAPSVAAAVAQPDLINVAAAAGTIFATAVAGLLVRRSERKAQHGN
jgi:hypothetical protein